MISCIADDTTPAHTLYTHDDIVIGLQFDSAEGSPCLYIRILLAVSHLEGNLLYFSIAFDINASSVAECFIPIWRIE